ncbi:MAG: hypothetical protein M1828_000488 [Chrysothrix sp. TS-e1954]|nr:MAG: hypothetical protein M1828_000488 [Chrysothrix sp. TS-e1954]
MIIRESPSRPKQTSTWPPRSPHEALLSSPSRRKKLSDIHNRGSTSPSPSKRRRLDDHTTNDENDDPNGIESGDDEETLQLKLQAIEARLKLKRLRKAKSGNTLGGLLRPTSEDERAHERLAPRGVKSPRQTSPIRKPGVEIALSPNQRPPQPGVEASPKRAQLGIDKGLAARNVSLKRARRDEQEDADKHRRHDAPAKSFSERLADARGKDNDRRSHEERMARSRSKGFSVGEPTKGVRKGPLSGAESDPHDASRPGTKTANSSDPSKSRHVSQPMEQNPQDDVEDDDGDDHKWNRFKYTTRTTSDRVLTQAFADKELFSIPKLLAQVVAPTYDPPDLDNDYVVYGIIAHKTAPHSHTPTHKINSNADPDEDAAKQRSKFMVLHLTDLKWQLDLFLFDSAFDQFWKLTVGTVIAILNPAIMPPKPHMRHSGNFALKLSSSEDTILEIGHAKDLGWCKSIKKDGKQCSQWIDTRKTEFCELHVNLAIEKTKAGRMEINSMAGIDIFGLSQKKQGRGGMQGRGSARGRGKRGGKGERSSTGRYYDREAHEVAYQIPVEHQQGLRTAKILDAEDYAHGGLTKAERSRKRLAEHQKERDLAKQLGAVGTGVGRDYMRQRHTVEDGADEGATHSKDPQLDAKSLGLMHSRDAAVKLSPVKGGKLRGDMSVAQPMGWSGAYKRGLASPERQLSPTRGAFAGKSERPKQLADREQTPAAKRARFMIEKKGIRHPGRESLAENASRVHDDDDDDDLDIV